MEYIRDKLIYDKRGYSGFITIILVAIILTIFEILFFSIVIVDGVSASTNDVVVNIKKTLNKKYLSNKSYCYFLYKNKAFINLGVTDDNDEHQNHSFNNFYNNCRNYDNSDFDDLENKLNLENKVDTEKYNNEIFTSSLYDYFNKHPEMLMGNDVLVKETKKIINLQSLYNGLELLIIFLLVMAVTSFAYNNAGNKELKKTSKMNIFANVSLTLIFIIYFQIYFYRNITTGDNPYEFPGSSTNEIFKYYLDNY
tara:strand:+ start:8937 stop:9695 length:759 start_codon:yes stop_codon:yes gene_type:complete